MQQLLEFLIYIKNSKQLNKKECNYVKSKIRKLFKNNNELSNHICVFTANNLIKRFQSGEHYSDILNSLNNNKQIKDIRAIESNEKQSNSKEMKGKKYTENSDIVCFTKEWNILLYDKYHDSYCGILLNPFPKHLLETWFFTVKQETHWERPLMIPRFTAWFVSYGCNCSYKYGKITIQPTCFPKWLQEITSIMLSSTKHTFDNPPNACNINWYIDGNDSVGWHDDNEYMFGSEDVLIISLSLGSTRKFRIKSKDGYYDHKIDLNNGDLLTMEKKFQMFYLHSLPKENKKTVGQRINLTWRWIKKHNIDCHF